MPKRRLRKRQSDRDTPDISGSHSDVSVPADYGLLEGTVHPTRVPTQEFLPRASSAAISACHSSGFAPPVDGADENDALNTSAIGVKLESFLLRASNYFANLSSSTSRLNNSSVTDNAPLLSSLIEFAFSRSSHVAFGEDSRLAFSHLFLREWDPQYETLDYPPAAGPYAVYERDDFFENIGYALTRIHMERLKESGLMEIRLTSPFTGVPCSSLLKKASSTAFVSVSQHDSMQSVQEFWHKLDRVGLSEPTTSVRRIAVIALDAFVLFLGTISFVLCVRSLVRGFLMWRLILLWLFSTNLSSIRSITYPPPMPARKSHDRLSSFIDRSFESVLPTWPPGS
ncbi:unnamed protein product [Echinostoma caproni]|uniref:PKD_channel domain-containing protein n=1 Tax=Echinostoma caproni TaxID=27848 RepID=A0A183AIA5_9TREM|nr:unnamed protein product [Echinostoma caproni]